MRTFLLVIGAALIAGTAAIAAVTKEWAGALPFTVIYEPNGTLTFFRQGKIDPENVRTELNKLLTSSGPEKTSP